MEGLQGGRRVEGSRDFDLIDHPFDAVKPENGLLGKLLLVEVWQIATEEKYPLGIALTGDRAEASVRYRP